MVKMKFYIFLCLLISSFELCFSDVIDLNDYEYKVYSQNGEDGVLKEIFSRIGVTNRYFVEFGVEDGQECNTRLLRENEEWAGLMMDGGYDNLSIGLFKELVTAENIEHLFKKYKVPFEPDLLSIDIDSNDLYVWRACLNTYRPRVVVIEYNALFAPQEDKMIPYHPGNRWDGSYYFGASALALLKLARLNGYSLVYIEKRGVNCFFIRDDVLDQCNAEFKNLNNLEALYRPYNYGMSSTVIEREAMDRRSWTSFDKVFGGDGRAIERKKYLLN